MPGNRPQQSPLNPPGASSTGNDHANPDDRSPTPAFTRELFGAVERFHRNIAQFRRHLSAAQAVAVTNMSSGSDRELRRRFNRDPEPPDADHPSSNTPYAGLPPLRSLHHRMSMASPGSRSSRYRDRILHRSTLEARASPTYTSSFTGYEDDSRNAGDAGSQLRALLDWTANPILPPPGPHPMSPPLQTQEPSEESRRIKRRKLDSDRSGSTYKGVRYGKYGQVEPGQLTMEIVSCDGGLFSDGTSYAAENMLRNDASVYCTKSSRCNIVLRHQGGTVFSLKELTIKAPGSDYTCPVREGMVFVSMKMDEYMQRTSQYQIQYLPWPRRTSPVYSVRHNPQEPMRMRRTINRPYRRHPEAPEEDYRTAEIPAEFSVSPTPLNVTTECFDDRLDDEGNPQPGFLRSRRRTPRIGSLPFESDNSDNDGDVWGPSGSDWSFDEMQRLRYSSQGTGDPGAGASSSSMTLEEAQEANQLATQEAVRAVGGELMAPLARFFIEKSKNRCTITFNPPVSGRFILLKMWSPHHDPKKNIDIQAVIAKGFAGPQLLPSVDLL